MQQFFEVKYLAIVWKNSEEVRSIKESLSSEKIEQINTRNYFSELSTYTRLEDGSDGQIGIHFFDESLIFTPCFIDAANNEIPLRKIEDKVSKKSWWIEDGKWKEKYRESPLWNHVGKTQIKLDKYIFYHIDVRANTFSIENLNLYLEDFRASFWELIYKPDSYTTGDAKENKIKTLNSDTLKKMGDFIKFIELILKNPKKELKEIQALKSIKKNKPVSKTFMEIATIGMKKNLTSRDYVESFNVAENKYVHYILNRIFILISRMINIANRSEIGFKKAQQHEQNRLDKYFNKKTLTID